MTSLEPQERYEDLGTALEELAEAWLLRRLGMDWESLLQLRVLDSKFEFRDDTYVLDQKFYALGRLPRDYEPRKDEILFREPTLSRVHATLTWLARRGGYQLQHKSDVNPTLVNGRPTKKILLTPGDQIQLGHLLLELEEVPLGTKSCIVDRIEFLRKLHAVVAETEQKYAHVKIKNGNDISK